MAEDTENKGEPVSTKIYPRTLMGLKTEQFRRLQEVGEKTTHADLLELAWDAYEASRLPQESKVALAPGDIASQMGLKTREQRDLLNRTVAALRLRNEHLFKLLDLVLRGWEGKHEENAKHK